MSFRVLVVPEDPTYNGAILKPLVEAILADVGKSNARVTVLTSPRLNGYDQAVQALRNELPGRYAFFDLWLFVPDADRASPAAMRSLESTLSASGIELICCPAEPEVEIYACVPFRNEIGLSWAEVRSHSRLKEVVFEPLLKRHGDSRRASGGRDLMISEALKNLAALYALCPELRALRDRLAERLS